MVHAVLDEEAIYTQYARDRLSLTLAVFNPEKICLIRNDGSPLLNGYVLRYNEYRVVVLPGNQLELSEDEAALEKHVRNVLDTSCRSCQWRIYSSRRRLVSVLDKNGFCLEEVSSVMILYARDFVPSDHIPTLSIVRVRTKKEMDDFKSIHATFSESAGSFISGFDISHPVFRERFYFFVGYENDKPATCCCAIRTENGAAGLHMVATHVAYRNSGYATNIVEHTIKTLREEDPDLVRIVLASTQEGIDIYKRLGFSHMFEMYSYNHRTIKCNT